MCYYNGRLIHGRPAIRIQDVFSAIKEINEALSLTNEPDKLVNAALDTFSQALEMECCWIQTISGGRGKKLTLAGERGFTPEIRAEVAALDMHHRFSEMIIGAGTRITIPELSRDGLYGLPSFQKAGYRWMVAVPMMTYRPYGIFGAASRRKKSWDKDTADLIMVIAGMIAGGLSKAYLTTATRGPIPAAGKPADVEEAAPVIKETAVPPAPRKPNKNPAGERYHPRKTSNYKKLHP